MRGCAKKKKWEHKSVSRDSVKSLNNAPPPPPLARFSIVRRAKKSSIRIDYRDLARIRLRQINHRRKCTIFCILAETFAPFTRKAQPEHFSIDAPINCMHRRASSRFTFLKYLYEKKKKNRFNTNRCDAIAPFIGNMCILDTRFAENVSPQHSLAHKHLGNFVLSRMLHELIKSACRSFRNYA